MATGWRKYSDDKLKQVIRDSRSWKDVCIQLGVKPATGAQYYISKRAKTLNVDLSHFTGASLFGPNKIKAKGRSLADYLENKFPIGSHVLKLKLIAAGVKPNYCEKCKLAEWLDEPLPLELDHLNGVHADNRLENLRILCPNCHAVKTRKESVKGILWEGYYVRQPKKATKKDCPKGCGRKVYIKSACCLYCRPQAVRAKATKITWPSNDELRMMVARSNFLALGRQLGVSDNAIRKRLRRDNLAKVLTEDGAARAATSLEN